MAAAERRSDHDATKVRRVHKNMGHPGIRRTLWYLRRDGQLWATVINRRIGEDVDASLGAWELAAAAKGLLTGSVVIWMTGNNVYSKLTNVSSFDRSSLEDIGHTARAVVRRIQRRADFVLIFGPVPRLAGELDAVAWEATAAYHLERTLKREVMEERSMLIPMGRALTRKISCNRHGLKTVRLGLSEIECI